ncbi:MAG: hypothetical protein VB954_10245 [Thalassolituus sp.]|uniref:hypothetical protein n=1 Tax=Thalassolituus TaxID=187492 RepID=UPI0023EF7204|nr:hypothetical protein [Thalassolituus oleivorans]
MNQTLRHTLEGHTAAPDQLDWSQIHETLAMLALAVAQIDTSLVEGNNSINSLTASFTRMADHTQLIIDRVTALDAGVGNEIADSARIIQSEVMSAIVAFQFYDRLTQRMEHVGDSLERTGHLISNPEERYHLASWKTLQNHIKSNYTMEAERIMFEHIMAGHSIAEALQIYHHNFNAEVKDDFDTSDDIELF